MLYLRISLPFPGISSLRNNKKMGQFVMQRRKVVHWTTAGLFLTGEREDIEVYNEG